MKQQTSPASDDAACSSGPDRFRPDNVNPTEFRCRDCEEWHGMSSERGIPNGQLGVFEGRRWCVVRCFCRQCWERRRAKHSQTNSSEHPPVANNTGDGDPGVRNPQS